MSNEYMQNPDKDAGRTEDEIFDLAAHVSHTREALGSQAALDTLLQVRYRGQDLPAAQWERVDEGISRIGRHVSRRRRVWPWIWVPVAAVAASVAVIVPLAVKENGATETIEKRSDDMQSIRVGVATGLVAAMATNVPATDVKMAFDRRTGEASSSGMSIVRTEQVVGVVDSIDDDVLTLSVFQQPKPPRIRMFKVANDVQVKRPGATEGEQIPRGLDKVKVDDSVSIIVHIQGKERIVRSISILPGLPGITRVRTEQVPGVVKRIADGRLTVQPTAGSSRGKKAGGLRTFEVARDVRVDMLASGQAQEGERILRGLDKVEVGDKVLVVAHIEGKKKIVRSISVHARDH